MIHIVEIELGKNSQFFVEITIMTRPPICVSLGSVKNEASLTRYLHLEVMTTADLAEIVSRDMGDWLDTSQTKKCVKTGFFRRFFGTFLAADLAGNTSLSGALGMLKVITF